MAGEKIARLLQKATAEAANSTRIPSLLFGEVLSTNPLEIKVDSRYIIDEEFIVLSSLCMKKTINDSPTGQVLWRGLEVGDNVRMLRVQGGQMFYILDREGGLTIL